jgi:hypothetical protein
VNRSGGAATHDGIDHEHGSSSVHEYVEQPYSVVDARCRNAVG